MRLGFAVKVLGAGGLASHDTRRHQSEPSLAVSLDHLEAILGYLYQHAERPDFQVRFQWQPHSVAFWDNRAVQHLAVWDYFPETRSGSRVTIKGQALAA